MKKIINNSSNELIIMMLIIIILGILIILASTIINKKKKELEETLNNGLNNKKISKIDKNLTLEKLTEEIFNLYKAFILAKTKFDYDTLKQILTNDLYLKEEGQLQQLKNKKQKLIANDINLENLKILDIKNNNIITKLHVSHYDYIIDNKKTVIRGTKESKYQIEYLLTIKKNNNKYFKLTNITTTGKWIKTK